MRTQYGGGLIALSFNAIEITNALIAIVLFYVIYRRQDAGSLLWVLFFYCTLHFSFAIYPLFSSEHTLLLGNLHLQGSGWLAKISALSLLICVFYLLGGHAYATYSQSLVSEKRVVNCILAGMIAVFGGYMFNLRPGDLLQLKNTVSIEAMLFLIMIGFLGLRGRQGSDKMDVHFWIVPGLGILSLIVCVSVFEVVSHRSWAGTLETSGAMVYRASATLFNPNLLGIWASLVYLGGAFHMFASKKDQKLMMLAMILTSCAIYFTGSRSAILLLMLALIVAFMMTIVVTREKLRWVPLAILPMTVISIYASVHWLIIPFVADTVGWHEIELLALRFAATPKYLVYYGLMVIGYEVQIPVEIAISMEGRLIGGVGDAVGGAGDGGWITLYSDIGWLGMIGILGLWLLALCRGLISCFSNHYIANVYALSVLCYCLLIGLVMRFQIFPVWVLISIVLTLCLLHWVPQVPISTQSKPVRS